MWMMQEEAKPLHTHERTPLDWAVVAVVVVMPILAEAHKVNKKLHPLA